MHGFSLANCDMYVEHKMMHPLIERCYQFLKSFKDADSVQIIFDIYGIDLIISIFRNVEKDMFFINVFCDGTNISKYALVLPETEKFTNILNLKPKIINLVYVKNNKITNKINITDKII